MRRVFGLLAAVAVLGPAAPGAAQLRLIETDELRLIWFSPALDHLVPHAGRCFHNSLDFQERIYGFESAEKLTLVLRDFSDRGNAYAGAVPRNQLQFEVAPTDFSFETFVAPERLCMIMNHELTHVTTMDEAAPSDETFRRLFFGKVFPVPEHPESVLYLYLTTPRVAAPGWFKEGIAVFNETWMAGGIGRAQGSYDEMVFRSMVLDESRFFDPLGLVSKGVTIDFQVRVNAYLYGTRFMSYLAYRFSPEHLVRWVPRSEDGARYWAADFERVFGLPLEQAWQDWIEFEHEFQQANLERIREYPITPYDDISDRALGSISRAYLDRDAGEIYAAFNYPGVVAHIGAISLGDGSVRRIRDIKGPAIYSVTSLAFDPFDKRIFYTTDHTAHRDLRVVDPATGKGEILMRDARIGDLVFDRTDRSIWGIRHLNGIATLVTIQPPYREWVRVRSWPYGEVVYDLDVSPDGSLISATVGEVGGRHLLRVFDRTDLLDPQVSPADLSPAAEVDFGTTIPLNFTFSEDGRYLYGSSYYTGAANVFRYELATEELEAVSNTETGFFRPIPLGDGRLIVFRYTGEGFVPTVIEAEPLEDINAITFFGQKVIEKHPQLREWRVGSPARIPLESMITREDEYGTFRGLDLESIYPVVEGYKSTAAYGFRVNFSDYLGLNRANLVATYSPDDDLASDERLHAELEFERYNFRARATYNDADFYDLFGPTKTSRKGYSLGVGWSRWLIFDRPRELKLDIDGVYYGDIERLPDFQNVVATFDELLVTEARLHYEHLRGSLGRVDDEKGIAWELVLTNNWVNDEAVPSLRGGFDIGVPLPIKHSSIWLRTAAGGAEGEIDDPFANFFFGGFGNNWVDHREEKRYREYYSFPGLELNDVGGRTFAKAMLELNLPPLRFERVGWQSFYMTWARTSLFAAGLATNPDRSELRRELGTAGVQVDFRFTLISNLDLTLSLGYGMAFEERERPRDEFMASVKLISL